MRRVASIAILFVTFVTVASIHRCSVAFASSSSSSSSSMHHRRAAAAALVAPRAKGTTTSSSSSARLSVAKDDVGEEDDVGDCFVGFDLGTSGARMSIVERRRTTTKATTRGGEIKSSNDWSYEEVVTESLKWDDTTMRYDDADAWNGAVRSLLSRGGADDDDGASSRRRIKRAEIMARVRAICVSGTSASCLLVDRRTLEVTRKARMYNYDIVSSSSEGEEDDEGGLASRRAMDLLDRYVPPGQTARAATGSLAKLLLWNEQRPLATHGDGICREVLCHQSDYVSMSLMREGLPVREDVDDDDAIDTTTTTTTTSDWHNCLKLGYDVRERTFPPWMHDVLGEEGAGLSHPASVLPTRVVSPGMPIGRISPVLASVHGLPTDVVVVGGTTDSNAAFFAAAGADPIYGTAVTSLGSTLAIKMLSRTFVEDASRGVYSHRFPRFGGRGDRRRGGGGEEGREEEEEEEEEAWLIGGASNVGCAVLRSEGYTDEELMRLSAEIDPTTDSPLSYYPLTKRGERFPVADGAKEPILSPKPDCRREFLHAILQGISDVERDGFRALGELGASPSVPGVVLSCGGGSRNDVWTSMRERRLMEICDTVDEEREEEGVRGKRCVEVRRATNTEASYGAALLAAASFAHEGNP
ncbi:hypothetical protein ACHAXA_008771 [Cyclostephanos tholiformis]|uniref:Glycerol kinase n=1 Tax=Cyclostephanos tholiformis TaxID=382380 RepID=A0ABD3RH11_9STRA